MKCWIIGFENSITQQKIVPFLSVNIQDTEKFITYEIHYLWSNNLFRETTPAKAKVLFHKWLSAVES